MKLSNERNALIDSIAEGNTQAQSLKDLMRFYYADQIDYLNGLSDEELGEQDGANMKLSPAVLITNHSYADYFYFPASITVQIGSHKATLKNGLNYIHNDYKCPSNTLEVYDEGSDRILFRLDQSYESIIDNDDFIAEINGECGTSYTAGELADIRNTLIDTIALAQQSIRKTELI